MYLQVQARPGQSDIYRILYFNHELRSSLLTITMEPSKASEYAPCVYKVATTWYCTYIDRKIQNSYSSPVIVNKDFARNFASQITWDLQAFMKLKSV